MGEDDGDLLREENVDAQQQHTVNGADEEEDGKVPRDEQPVVEHALCDDEGLVQSKGEDANTAHDQSGDDLLRVPRVGGSAPGQTDKQRRQGASKDQDSDVVDLGKVGADIGVQSAETRRGRVVEDEDEQARGTVEAGVQVVGPSPGVVFDKDARGQRSGDDGNTGEGHDEALRPWAEFVGGDFKGCGYTDDLKIVGRIVSFGRAHCVLLRFIFREHTQPALARPPRACPPIKVVACFEDPAITPPATPMSAGKTMNHFLPNLSLKEPLCGLLATSFRDGHC